MAYEEATRSAMLDGDGITHAALFDGDPGSGGTECAGGSPAYARKAVTRGAASGGVKSATGSIVFDVPSGFYVKWVGWYTASSGGTRKAKHHVTERLYGSQGTYTLTAQTFTIADA